MTTARNPLMDPAAGDVVQTVSGLVLGVEGPHDLYPNAWRVRVEEHGTLPMHVTLWRDFVRGGTVLARGGDE